MTTMIFFMPTLFSTSGAYFPTPENGYARRRGKIAIGTVFPILFISFSDIRYKMKKPYIPIDCGFHDMLILKAMRGAPCDIEYYLESGAMETVRAAVEDIFTERKEEFLRLSTGEVIRLDRIARIDGWRPPSKSDGGATSRA
jgi:Rho-binding antiterminator